MAKLVPLTQGKYAIVEDDDYERVMFSDWHAMNNHGRWYACGSFNGRKIYMHRFLMGEPDGLDVDHRNHNGLDNRLTGNLRISTRAENLQARNTWSQYGYRGVSWEGRRRKWASYIKIDGITRYLGLSENIEDAARLYDEAALLYYGEFAYQNFDTREVIDDPIWHDKTKILLVGGGHTLVDEEDWDDLYPYRWRLHKNKDGCQRVVRGSGLKMFYMHREIMDIKDPAIIVDHKNGTGWDNRKQNLRPTTRQNNAFNQKLERINNTSGYKGVTFFKSRNKWVSQITHNYKHINLGYFDSAIEAAKKYDEKARELFGQFARLNFPD